MSCNITEELAGQIEFRQRSWAETSFGNILKKGLFIQIDEGKDLDLAYNSYEGMLSQTNKRS